MVGALASNRSSCVPSAVILDVERYFSDPLDHFLAEQTFLFAASGQTDFRISSIPFQPVYTISEHKRVTALFPSDNEVPCFP